MLPDLKACICEWTLTTVSAAAQSLKVSPADIDWVVCHSGADIWHAHPQPDGKSIDWKADEQWERHIDWRCVLRTYRPRSQRLSLKQFPLCWLIAITWVSHLARTVISIPSPRVGAVVCCPAAHGGMGLSVPIPRWFPAPAAAMSAARCAAATRATAVWDCEGIRHDRPMHPHAADMHSMHASPRESDRMPAPFCSIILNP